MIQPVSNIFSRRAVLRRSALLALASQMPRPTATAAAQTAESAADGQQVLFSAVVETLPAPPATVTLHRITVEAGDTAAWPAMPGPRFVAVEAGGVAIAADGEAVGSRAEREGQAAAAFTTAPGEPVEMLPNDQLALPAGVGAEIRNDATEAGQILVVTILPEGAAAASPVAAPASELASGGSTVVLGEAVAPGWPAAPLVVQLDRLTLAAGGTMPGFPGPVLLAIDDGALEFALIAGAVQAPSAGAAGDVFKLEAGQAIFFTGGVGDLPLEDDAAAVEILRFGVTTLPALPEAASTPAAATEETAGGEASVPSADAGSATAPARVRVTQDGVRLRSAPSTNGEIVAEADQGAELVVTGAAEEAEGLRWLPVRVEGDPPIEGYIAEQFVEPVG